MSRVTLIVAATANNGIGHAGKLPWRLPQEMQYFAKVTSGKDTTQDVGGEKKNAVVMGRATWESIPHRFRPLAGRINIIVSRQAEYNLCVNLAGEIRVDPRTALANRGVSSTEDGVILASSLEAALQRARAANASRLFVIGGEKLYAAALPLAERVLLTRIVEPTFEECDVFMPDFIMSGVWTRVGHEALSGWVGFDVPRGLQSERGVQYEFEMWTRGE